MQPATCTWIAGRRTADLGNAGLLRASSGPPPGAGRGSPAPRLRVCTAETRRAHATGAASRPRHQPSWLLCPAFPCTTENSPWHTEVPMGLSCPSRTGRW